MEQTLLPTTAKGSVTLLSGNMVRLMPSRCATISTTPTASVRLAALLCYKAPVKSKTIITFNHKEQADDIQVTPLWKWVLAN